MPWRHRRLEGTPAPRDLPASFGTDRYLTPPIMLPSPVLSTPLFTRLPCLPAGRRWNLATVRIGGRLGRLGGKALLQLATDRMSHNTGSRCRRRSCQGYPTVAPSRNAPKNPTRGRNRRSRPSTWFPSWSLGTRKPEPHTRAQPSGAPITSDYRSFSQTTTVCPRAAQASTNDCVHAATCLPTPDMLALSAVRRETKRPAPITPGRR